MMETYKDKKRTKNANVLLQSYKLRIISIVITLAVVISLSILKLNTHFHERDIAKLIHNAKQVSPSHTGSNPPGGLNDGRREVIDISMDSRVVGSISKSRSSSYKIASNEAGLQHVGTYRRSTAITRPDLSLNHHTKTQKQDSTPAHSSLGKPESNTRVVALDQHRGGLIKVVDRIVKT